MCNPHSHLPAELFAVVIRILVGVPYGMSSLMILSIDLLTEVRAPPEVGAVSGSSHSGLAVVRQVRWGLNMT